MSVAEHMVCDEVRMYFYVLHTYVRMCVLLLGACYIASTRELAGGRRHALCSCGVVMFGAFWAGREVVAFSIRLYDKTIAAVEATASPVYIARNTDQRLATLPSSVGGCSISTERLAGVREVPAAERYPLLRAWGQSVLVAGGRVRPFPLV